MSQDLDQHSTLPPSDIGTPGRPNKRVILRRYIGALFIYLIYWTTIFGAFRSAVAYASLDKAQELVKKGIIESVHDYGWGDHYVWSLIAFCVATFCSAVLAGATAKRRGCLLASIANAPILLLIGLCSYFYYTRGPDCSNPAAWGIALPASIAGSIVLSALGGSQGEQWQRRAFGDNTILGIRPVHWWWLIFPLNLLIQSLPGKIVYTILLLLGSTQVMRTKYAILSFLVFAAFATFTYFTAWGWYKTFRLLSMRCPLKPRKPSFIVRVLFYLFGIPLLFDVFCALLYTSIGWVSQY